MHLKELLQCYPSLPPKTVPDWMIGCFKRRSITFANGQTDLKTHVFWLQGRNLTIDLRLPIDGEQVSGKSWRESNPQELAVLADYEGWSADTAWNDGLMKWSGGTSFQLHNRWPEPAMLSRVGDCMIEVSPSGSLLEDWRIQSKSAGPLVSLKLIEEINLTTGKAQHCGGALIINNNWAALVLGRAEQLTAIKPSVQLREMITANTQDHKFLEHAFNFETSVAKGSLDKGFDISYSTRPERMDQPLFNLTGFEYDNERAEVVQVFNQGGNKIKRRYLVDTLEQTFNYSSKTAWTSEAKAWFDAEQKTLGRYLEALT